MHELWVLGIGPCDNVCAIRHLSGNRKIGAIYERRELFVEAV